jgi:hypothetical protein
MLVYLKSRVTGPNFLFTVGITRRVIIALLALFAGLLLFLKPFLKGLKHDCHIRHLLIAPILLVGLLCIGGLTCGCAKGLTILVILATLIGIVHLVGAAMSLAVLAKLLTANLLRDSIRRASR